MAPLFQNGDIVFAVRFAGLQKDDVVILLDPRGKRLLLKRIYSIKQNMFFVIGDNLDESTDSRTFGWIEKEYILGKVVLKI